MKSRHPADELSIVVPAFNEVAAVGITLDGLIERFPGAEIILVDDCSTDGTGDEAYKRAPIMVVTHEFNRGQGAALKTGMRLATRKFVAWFDADNEHRVEDLQSCYEKALRDNLVAVIGQRQNPAASTIRGVGKWLIRLVGRGLSINAGSDLNCGLRVFRREIVLNYLHLIPNRFSASLVSTLIMLERRYPMRFEPIQTGIRIGNSTVRLKDGFDAMMALLRAVLLFAPMRFFLPPGLFFMTFGLAYSIVLALIRGDGIPIGGVMSFTTGLLLAVLGLVADQISQFRLSQLPEPELFVSRVFGKQ